VLAARCPVGPHGPLQRRALAAESTVEGALIVLCRSLTSALSATATQVSRRDGERLVDVAAYALRDVELGAQSAYLVGDFPLTVEVLEQREPRAMSFVDDRIDRAEAFVLRELGMNSLLMLPLLLDDDAWGLVEVYDVRMRRFEGTDIALAQELVALAADRLGQLRDEGRPLDRGGERAPLQRPMRADRASGREHRAGA
jgi:GAF domain-containing protein